MMWSISFLSSFPSRLKPYVKHRGEEIVILVETGGKHKHHNYSGFRRANGKYYKFESTHEWGVKFREVMDLRYSKRKNESVEKWIIRIAVRYNPQHQKEWIRRCFIHLKK